MADWELAGPLSTSAACRLIGGMTVIDGLLTKFKLGRQGSKQAIAPRRCWPLGPDPETQNMPERKRPPIEAALLDAQFFDGEFG